MAVSLSVGYAAAGSVEPAVQERGGGDTYAVTQGGNCFEISPVTGDEPVKSFYDYRTPFADNPFTNATGKSYSSEGTATIQRPNGSALFLYQDGTGNLSLVFVHGATHNASTGGSVSFNITGLPEDGTWAVKDDEYQGENNYDQWNHTPGTTQVNWTWGAEKTDGGAYAGLGDEFEITIDPAFNRSAALYGEYYNGTLENWTAVSNGAGNFDRTQLDMSRPVTISSGGCEDANAAARGANGDVNAGIAGATGDDDAADDGAADDDGTKSAERDDESELPDDGNDTGTDGNVSVPDENETDGDESDDNETDGDAPDPDDGVTDPDGNEADPTENDTGQNEDDTGTDDDTGVDDGETDGNESSDDGNESSDDDGTGTGDDATSGDDAANGDDDGTTDGAEDSPDDSGADDEGAADDGAEAEGPDDDGTAGDGTTGDGTDATDDESEAGNDESAPNDESGDDGESGGNETSP